MKINNVDIEMSPNCETCIRRVSGECREYGLETLCGVVYKHV